MNDYGATVQWWWRGGSEVIQKTLPVLFDNQTFHTRWPAAETRTPQCKAEGLWLEPCKAMTKRKSSGMLHLLDILNIAEDMNLRLRHCENQNPRKFRLVYPSLLTCIFLSSLFSLSSSFKCHVCAHNSLIPLIASVSQLSPSYWLLLWRHEHLICGCPSLIALIMVPLCATVDWACWLNRRTSMQLYILSDMQTAISSWVRGFE
jgi:hypothetical protein